MATRRPDLEALPYKNPGFIADTIFPVYEVEQKNGVLYYDDIVADINAQTDRTLGEAPTATRIDSARITFACAEKIARLKIDDSEIALRGGLAAAQAKMARKGKRAVAGAIEDLAVAATFGDIANIAHKDILDSFLKALDDAIEAVQDYADGKLAIFGARKVISRLKRYDEIVDRMKFTGVLPGDIRDVRSISDEQLAAALSVDVILPGPSSNWLGSGDAYDGYLGVCILPNKEVDPDEEVQLGRLVQYNDNGLFQVQTYYSDDLRSEVCDVSSWIQLQSLNKECCYILTGIDEGNTVTTTAA